MERILIIGAAGQIGSELTLELRKIYGNANVFATDVKEATADIRESGPFQLLDVMDDKHLIHFVIRNKITQIYHLAAVLSGNAEKLPTQAWHINMNGLMNILEVAKLVEDVRKVFWPSSIAVFGNSTPKNNTPQLTVMEPSTVYGISKLAGERWCEYYHKRYNVDIRSLRYPGLISYKTEPGGGTTDWAVEIYYEAVRKRNYTCFINENISLPMMFMEDAISATIRLMETDQSNLTCHSSYNITGPSLTPRQTAVDIRRHIPGFDIIYKPDNKYIVAAVEKVRKDGPAPLKDIKADIENRVKQQKKGEMLVAKFNAALSSAKTIEDLAGKMRLQIEPVSGLRFSSSSLGNAGVEPTIVAAALALDKGILSKPIVGENGVYVLTVNSITEPASIKDKTSIALARNYVERNYAARTNYYAYEAIKELAKIKDNRREFY